MRAALQQHTTTAKDYTEFRFYRHLQEVMKHKNSNTYRNPRSANMQMAHQSAMINQLSSHVVFQLST